MRGFSLVELLVVIAIIGILAAVGVVGYQAYIDDTKSKVTLDNATTIDRAFTHDVMVIENEITDGRTALATDIDQIITKESDCIEYVAAAVTSLNSTHKNPYNEAMPYAVSLHMEAEWASTSAASGTAGETRGAPLNVAKLKQGQIGLQCANACQPLSNSTDFYIHRCVCVNAEICNTHSFEENDGSANTAKYEAAVAQQSRWDDNGKILIGAHLPNWVCPKPQDAGNVCP